MTHLVKHKCLLHTELFLLSSCLLKDWGLFLIQYNLIKQTFDICFKLFIQINSWQIQCIRWENSCKNFAFQDLSYRTTLWNCIYAAIKRQLKRKPLAYYTFVSLIIFHKDLLTWNYNKMRIKSRVIFTRA